MIVIISLIYRIVEFLNVDVSLVFENINFYFNFFNIEFYEFRVDVYYKFNNYLFANINDINSFDFFKK